MRPKLPVPTKMKRMEELLEGGTTLLFVSHNTEEVKKLCKRAIGLDHGNIIKDDPADEVCAEHRITMENRG